MPRSATRTVDRSGDTSTLSREISRWTNQRLCMNSSARAQWISTCCTAELVSAWGRCATVTNRVVSTYPSVKLMLPFSRDAPRSSTKDCESLAASRRSAMSSRYAATGTPSLFPCRPLHNLTATVTPSSCLLNTVP
eukprot:scaffold531_cov92-Isochrysis_galbana.AAC.5